MATRLLLLISLVLVSTVLLTGAWPGNSPPSAPRAEPTFAPQSVPLAADLQGASAERVLQLAQDRLAWSQVHWLKTKIRQSMTDADSNFTAEGFLQRGPNFCARLELNVATKWEHSKLLIVSDGEVVAQIRTLPGQPEKAVVDRIAGKNEDGRECDPVDREQFLASVGCGGPLTLLVEFRQSLRKLESRTGKLDGKPVIQINGELDTDKAVQLFRTASALNRGSIYLDAQTLWPCRMEWSSAAGSTSTRPILRVDYFDAALNEELDMKECARLFSYQPE